MTDAKDTLRLRYQPGSQLSVSTITHMCIRMKRGKKEEEKRELKKTETEQQRATTTTTKTKPTRKRHTYTESERLRMTEKEREIDREREHEAILVIPDYQYMNESVCHVSMCKIQNGGGNNDNMNRSQHTHIQTHALLHTNVQ